MAAQRPSNQPNSDLPVGSSPNISPAVRKQLQRCFERAREVLRQEKPDHDYAHTMYSECVLKDPGNLEFVEAMLENLQRKYKNNKRGASFKGFGGRSAFKKAVAAEDWDEVLQLGLELLRTNPWDVPALRAMADACRNHHHNEVELRYLKNALDVNRKDIDVNRHCAESLERMGQFDQAIACWHRIEELDKTNEEARRKISELTLAKARGLPGVDTSASGRASKAVSSAAPKPPATDPRSLPTAPASPPASSAPMSSSDSTKVSGGPAASSSIGNVDESIEGLQAVLAKDPTDLDAYQRLAELLTQQSRFRDAVQTLKRALEAAGGNHLEIRERLEDAQIRMIRAQVAIAERRANAENTTEAHDLVRRFRSELNRQELAVLASRSERYPQDLALRFELGLRLKREGNYREGLKAFETARNAPELRANATLEMGECYQQLKQYSQSLKCYQAAISLSTPPSDIHHLALYRGGVLAMALKNLEVAHDCLAALVKSDASYRDAAARLDKVREIRDKE